MKRVLVVDDSLTIRKWVVETIEEQPDFEVVGEAVNGKEAIRLAETLKPDIITMDMMMPEMTGLAATEYIMAHCPTRILVVSASTNRGELMKTYDALAAGAISVVEKPKGIDVSGFWEKKLINELHIVSRIPVIHHLKGKYKTPNPIISKPETITKPVLKKYNIVAIGASTGGPLAMLEIFKSLPEDFPVPIVSVIHISENFSVSIAEWFDLNSDLKVTFAREGDSLRGYKKGKVYLAPVNSHLIIENNDLKLIQTPLRNFCRPSVDVLFESVALRFKDSAIGVLLTGMGKDGAEGLKAIYDAGGHTIAQDEASCVVYGMPKVAMDLGAVKESMSYKSIAKELMRLVS